MGEYLGVTASHVRELSADQDQAAGQISSAAGLTAGVSGSMWISHGLVAAPANIAVAQVHSAREGACSAMSSVSSDLSDKLDTAAQRYEAIDEEMRRRLSEQMCE